MILVHIPLRKSWEWETSTKILLYLLEIMKTYKIQICILRHERQIMASLYIFDELFIYHSKPSPQPYIITSYSIRHNLLNSWSSYWILHLAEHHPVSCIYMCMGNETNYQNKPHPHDSINYYNSKHSHAYLNWQCSCFAENLILNCQERYKRQPTSDLAFHFVVVCCVQASQMQGAMRLT